MRSEQEIREKLAEMAGEIAEGKLLLANSDDSDYRIYMQNVISITRGWVRLLEWVIEERQQVTP